MSQGRYRAYPKYKDSGVEWLGPVPSHWDTRRLKFLAHEIDLRAEKQNLELLGLSKTLGVVRRSELEQGAQEANDYSKYRVASQGDLVMNRMQAWNGVFALSPYHGMVSPDYAVFRFYNPECASFLASLFRTPLMAGEFLRESRGMGTAFLRLNTPDFLAISVPQPPLPEQTQIAKFLDHETAKIDRLIEKQEELIRLLKEKRQAVISHAVTKGLNPHAPLKDSGIPWLGQVPAHWTEYPLKTLCRIKHGYAFDSDEFSDSGEFVLMTPGNFIQRGGFRHMNPPKYYVGKNYPKEFILRPRQLLVAMTEQGPGLLGCSLFVPSEGLYLHNQRLGLVRDIRSDKLSDRYLFHLFNSPRYRAEVSISATGTKVQHTSPEKLLSIRVWIPEVPEQVAIADFIDAAIVKFDALEAKADNTIALLQERRTALISAAVTGKIDVRHWQPADTLSTN